MARKTPAETLSSFSVAEEQLKADRKAKSAESELKQAKAKLAASEKEVDELRKRLSVFDRVGKVSPKKFFKWGKSSRGGSASAIVLLSDWHVEEPVDPEKVNGLNEYSLDIADKSIKEVLQRSVRLIDNERYLSNIQEIVVHLGGDFVSGFIHEELAEECVLHPMEAIRWCSERIAGGLKFLLDETGLKHMRVITSYGNHSRTTKKRRIATGAESSYEYNMYKILESSIVDKRIQWQIGKGYHNIADIQGKVCRFHHGDAVRFFGAIGGITTTIEKSIRAWNSEIKASFDFQGHYHQALFGKKWVMNGSLIGYSPFAIEVKAEYEPPCQVMCVIDSDRGMVCSKRLFCREPHKPVFGSGG